MSARGTGRASRWAPARAAARAPAPARRSCAAAAGTRRLAPPRSVRCQDVGGVADHRLQPPRGEGGHRDVVLLVRAGRQRVHAGRVREDLFSLASERRSRARSSARNSVRRPRSGTAAAAIPPRRSASRCAARRSRPPRRSPPPSRRRRAPPAPREVAARHQHAVGGEDERLSVTALDSRSSTSAACRNCPGTRRPPGAGSAGNTDPARGRRRRGATRGCRSRRAARVVAGDVDLPGLAAQRVDPRVEGPSLPRAASTVIAPPPAPTRAPARSTAARAARGRSRSGCR